MGKVVFILIKIGKLSCIAGIVLPALLHNLWLADLILLSYFSYHIPDSPNFVLEHDHGDIRIVVAQLAVEVG